MKRIAFVIIWLCVSFLVNVVMIATTHATEQWEDGSIRINQQKLLDFRESNAPCSGMEYSIQVEGFGRRDFSCVFGKLGELRMARFVGNNVFKYAVSFPGQTQYYEVRNLCDSANCVYAPASDVILTQHYVHPYSHGAGVYKHFARSLVKHLDIASMTPYFTFEPQRPPDFIPMIQGGEPAIEAMVLSENGRWAVLEMRYFGLIRLNMDTLEAIRIKAPGERYGIFSDPRFDMAITNDGQHIAITGWNLSGVSVVTVKEGCGDRLETVQTEPLSVGATPCTVTAINTGDAASEVLYWMRPLFAAADRRLSVTALYKNGVAERNVFAVNGTVAANGVEVLGLGDSFSSGEGETDDQFYKPFTNSPQRQCHTSQRSYAYILPRYWGMRAESVACSGARTIDVIGGGEYIGQQPYLGSLTEPQRQAAVYQALREYQPGIISQAAFVSQVQPRIITIGIGGNDAGLMGKLQACIGLDTCEWAADSQKRYATAKEIGEVYYAVQSTIKTLKSASPTSKLYLIGYPEIINSSDDAPCDPIIGALLNPEERVFMNEATRYLNQVLISVAQDEKVHYVTVENALFDRTICGRVDESAMNAIRFGEDIAPIQQLKDFKVIGAESFHPTPTGHQRMADVIYQQLGPMAVYDICMSCGDYAGIPDIPDYWLGADAALAIRQIEAPNLISSVVRRNEPTTIQVPKYYFAPNSAVTVELHSQNVTIGTVSAQQDGSLLAEYALPDSIPPGYHVLHLLGTTPAGTLVDVYKTVAIIEGAEGEAPIVPSVPTHNPNQAPLESPTRTAADPIDDVSLLSIGHVYADQAVLGAQANLLPARGISIHQFEMRPHESKDTPSYAVVGVVSTGGVSASLLVAYLIRRKLHAKKGQRV
jgi:lysophospholipase L1-like esterase